MTGPKINVASAGGGATRAGRNRRRGHHGNRSHNAAAAAVADAAAARQGGRHEHGRTPKFATLGTSPGVDYCSRYDRSDRRQFNRRVRSLRLAASCPREPGRNGRLQRLPRNFPLPIIISPTTTRAYSKATSLSVVFAAGVRPTEM